MSIKQVLWLMFFAGISINAAFCNWDLDGGAVSANASQASSNPSIDVYNDTPYLAWQEEDNSTGKLQICVSYYDGVQWLPLSTSLNIDPNYDAQSPVIRLANGVPYVVWSENNSTGRYQIYVKKYNGVNWESVGGSLNVNPAKAAITPDIAFDGTTPYVIFSEQTFNHQIMVKHFNGSTWVQDGGYLNNNADNNADWPTIETHSGTPYAAWSEWIGTRTQAFVKSFDGNAWINVGSGNVMMDLDHNSGGIELTFIGNELFATWDESNTIDNRGQIYVKKYNGISWVQVGTGPLNYQTSNIAVASDIIGAGTTPYVAWHEYMGNGQYVFIKYFNGSDWMPENEVMNIGNSTTAQMASISATSSGIPIVAWQENAGSTFKVYVKHPHDMEPIIGAVSPDHALAGRSVTLNIYGAQFNTPHDVKLRDQNTLQEFPGSNVHYHTSQHISADFSMTGALAGQYVLIIKANITQEKLKQALHYYNPILPPLNWDQQIVATMENPNLAGSFGGIAIADGDDDGLQEIYAVNRSNNLFKYSKSGGSWAGHSVYSGGAFEYYSTIVIGDADNDKSKELYAGCLDNHIYQFDTHTWNKTDLGTLGSKVYNLACGDGDNDGLMELYAACADGFIYQIKNSNGHWTITAIGLSEEQKPFYHVAVGDGDSDGLFEVYGASFTDSGGEIYQFKYDAGSWPRSTVGTCSGGIYAMTIGDIDHNNALELYTADASGKVYQFQWLVTNWQSSDIFNAGSAIYSLVYGDGDSDGNDELYAATADGVIYKIDKPGGAWHSDTVMSGSTPLYRLALGDADNNNLLEIYSFGEDNKLHQIQAQHALPATPTPTITMTPISGFKGELLDKHYVYPAPHPIRGSVGHIYYYLAEPADVEIKIYTNTTHRLVISKMWNNVPAGKNRWDWNCSNMANGMYLLLIKANNQHKRSKVIRNIALIK